MEKAVEILKEDANNQKLDPVVVNYLIEFVGDDHQGYAIQDQNDVSI